jgi:signal transduction protein with GAF and PtsI domain
LKGFAEIKNRRIFTTIRDINEVLSLSSEPQRFLNMTLDTLIQVLEIECCWVQTVNATERSLQLAAERGFSSEMRRQLSAMDMGHNFSKHTIGAGNYIVIPDLSVDGRYGLSSFRAAGYRWLVAAPLMTYRVHGVLGIASRHKKRLHSETADLVMVIAGLIGSALNKAGLSRESWVPEKPRPPLPDKKTRSAPAVPESGTPSPAPASTAPDVPPEKKTIKQAEGAFQKHAYKMKSFRDLHR